MVSYDAVVETTDPLNYSVSFYSSAFSLSVVQCCVGVGGDGEDSPDTCRGGKASGVSGEEERAHYKRVCPAQTQTSTRDKHKVQA